MASYMRKFVTEHKAYRKDSVVNEEITWYVSARFTIVGCKFAGLKKKRKF